MKNYKKNDIIIFIGKNHNVLKTNEKYKIFSTTESGCLLHTKTGFVGVKFKYIKKI